MASSRQDGKNSRNTAAAARSSGAGQDEAAEFLTTAQGLRLPDTDHSLKAGERGPTLMEDSHLREKITHFDHERIHERVVHARGAAVHGVFESYGTGRSVTKAGFLAGQGLQTEVGNGTAVLEAAGIMADAPGVVTSDAVTKPFTDQLTAAVGLHRASDRASDVMASAVPPVLTTS